jgi:hypothetical protein
LPEHPTPSLMGKQFSQITTQLQSFIEEQKLFFVGTAAPEGRVNVSPKGMDTLRVLDANRIVWLNLTGSGNETAAHLLESNRMTIMFCAFEGAPNILRLYGKARALYPSNAAWPELIGLFPDLPGARQLFDMNVDLVQTSCGFGVPLMDYQGDRRELTVWAEKQGNEGLKDYQARKNRLSLDGKPTGM